MNRFLSVIAALLCTAPAAKAASGVSIDVRALIDGRSIIEIQNNQLYWHHLDYAAPGLWSGNNQPTVINGFDWFPSWPGQPAGEVRCGGCYSTSFDLGSIGVQIGSAPSLVSFVAIQARGGATVLTSPTAENGYLTEIDLNDDPEGGGDFYEVVITFASPELPGLVSHWKADGDVSDTKGVNPGALAGTTSYVAGEYGEAFHFAAGNFAAPTNGMPTGGADRTIAGWVYLDETPGTHGAGENFLFGYGAFGSYGATYHLGTSGTTLFFSQWGGAIFGPQLATGIWYHVAATTSAGVTSLWLNGEVQSSGGLGLSTPPSTQFFMGQIPGDSSRRMVGSVDDVYVFNRALSHDEINLVMRDQAVACVPAKSCKAGQDCGTESDGCGGTIVCGAHEGACLAGLQCGGGGAANTCGCTTFAQLPAGPVVAGNFSCNALSLSPGTTVRGNLTVPAGSSCALDGVAVTGDVHVLGGASFTALGAAIGGNLQAQGAQEVVVDACTTVHGNFQLEDTAGAGVAGAIGGNVELHRTDGAAGGGNWICAANIGGNLQLQQSTAAAPFDVGDAAVCSAGNSIHGNVQIQQNAAPVTVQSNLVGGNLHCAQNASIQASGNSVVHNSLGQCGP